METRDSRYLFENSTPLEEIPEEEVVDLAGYQVTKAAPKARTAAVYSAVCKRQP